MGRNRLIRFILPGLVMALACSAPLLKKVQEFDHQRVWRWGGGSLRRGWTEHELRPPLQLKWTHKSGSALGKAMIAAGGLLFFGEKGGTISIIDIVSGKKKERIKLEKRKEVTCALGSTRLIAAQRWGKKPLRAIDLKTGKVLWKSSIGPAWGEPLMMAESMFIGDEWGMLYNVNIENGSILWQRNFESSISGIAADDLMGVLTTDSGRVAAFDTESGRILWQVRLAGSIAAPPVISNDRIFAGIIEGSFYCLGLEDGQIKWKHEPVGAVYEMAAADDRQVVYGDAQGVVYAVDIKEGTENWQLQTHSVIGTSPLISGELIYIGTLNRRLLCIDGQTGEVEWEFETKGRIRTTPVIWQNMLIAASENWFVYGFEKETH